MNISVPRVNMQEYLTELNWQKVIFARALCAWLRMCEQSVWLKWHYSIGNNHRRNHPPERLIFYIIFFIYTCYIFLQREFSARARKVRSTFQLIEEIIFLQVYVRCKARGVGVVSHEMRISIGGNTQRHKEFPITISRRERLPQSRNVTDVRGKHVGYLYGKYHAIAFSNIFMLVYISLIVYFKD